MDEKMSSLAKKAVKAEDLDDGTFVAFLMVQDKLTPEEIYSSVSEILAASVDTVSVFYFLRGTASLTKK